MKSRVKEVSEKHDSKRITVANLIVRTVTGPQLLRKPKITCLVQGKTWRVNWINVDRSRICFLVAGLPRRTESKAMFR